MAVHLYSLRHVPDEEAAAIRALLEKHNISFYETGAGNWGISSPAIWLKHKQDKDRAKQLLEDFHLNWAASQREHFARQREAGEMETFLDRARRNPLQVIFYLAIALLILYISTKPFISL